LKLADLKSPALAGTVATVTGLAASSSVVLVAFKAIGASTAQAASGFMVMIALYGLLSIVLSLTYKMPISVVWSTPGAALLATAGGLGLSYQSAVGAFLVTGFLFVLTGLWPALGRLVSSIPKPIASAMLAGVIFPFCIAPFQSLKDFPLIIGPVLIVWLVLYKYATVWAAPISVALLFTLISFDQHITIATDSILPHLVMTPPQFSWAAVIGIGIPLYLVTMASQNVPGIAIMKSFGYEVPFRPTLTTLGVGTIAGAFFGGWALNLAAITAALNANEHAHKDPAKRYLSAVVGGVWYVILALFAGVTVAFVSQAPHLLILAAAGVALFTTITSAVSTIVEDVTMRLPAIITFLIGASGIALLSIGAAFWALLGGLLVLGWLKLRTRRQRA
jgi:benzoate membrane transport protein